LSRAAQLLTPFRSDFTFYAPRCLRILDKKGDLVPFRLNRAQAYLHQQIERQKEKTGKVRVLILKGRQQGMSTYAEGRLYWLTSGQFGKTAFILTHEDKATSNLFGMAKRYHNNCPEVLRPHTAHSNANELVFDRLHSRYAVGTAKTSATGRSFTIQYFHGSEVAFWPNAEENFAGLGQAIPSMRDTEVILESTANGIGNRFHTLWQEAMRGMSDYVAVFIPWMWQAEYTREATTFEASPEDREYAELYGLTPEQSAWRVQKIKDDFHGDLSLFDQEYPATAELAFARQQGDPMIPLVNIQKARKLELPEGRSPLVMGIDPSDGAKAALAIAFRRGRKAVKVERHYGLRPMEQVAMIVRRFQQMRPAFAYADAGGVGSGIIDRINELLGGKVVRVLFGERPFDRDRYGIRRDELWGEMREWFLNDDPDIPDDDVLAVDLSGPNKDIDSSQRVKLESKKSMEKRGLLSPDSGDALALTFTMRHEADAGTGGLDPERDFDWRAGG